MARLIVPAVTGTIIYKVYNSLDPIVIWLADASFYMPARDSLPTIDMVVPVGKNNLLAASISKINLPVAYFTKPSIHQLVSKYIQFNHLSGHVCYTVLSDTAGNLIWAKDLVYTNTDVILANESLGIGGLVRDSWALFTE